MINPSLRNARERNARINTTVFSANAYLYFHNDLYYAVSTLQVIQPYQDSRRMKTLFFKPPENIVSVTIRFLQSLGVKVTDSAVADALLSHPHYPSLLSVSNALQLWRIETLALHVTGEQLPELPLPLLTHITNDAGSFVIITEANSQHVFYTDDKGTQVKIDKDTFLELWNGNVLLAETNENSGEEHYKRKATEEAWRKWQTPLLLLLWLTTGVAGAVSFYQHAAFSAEDTIYFVLILITDIAGLIISGLLLLHNYDDSNPTLKKICSAGSTRSDCSAVLNSSASKLFSILSWADVGLVYFCGSYLYLTIAPYDSLFFLPLSLLSALTLPYTVFSIFYQWRVVKQWCILCLTIQVILLLQFAIGLFTGHFNLATLNSWRHMPWLSVWMAFFIPATSWAFIKPYLYKSRDAENIKKELNKFKSNRDIFHHLLLQDVPVMNAAGEAGITLGDPSSSDSIILVTNPFCDACGAAHAELEQLLHTRNDRKAELIFFVSNDETDEAYLVVTHFLTLAQLADKQTMHRAIKDWYEKKNYDSFSKAYPVSDTAIAEQRERVLAMNEWCLTENISFTPCAYVNGFRLPKQYNLIDLAYL